MSRAKDKALEITPKVDPKETRAKDGRFSSKNALLIYFNFLIISLQKFFWEAQLKMLLYLQLSLVH